jgi:hypothetical protein
MKKILHNKLTIIVLSLTLVAVVGLAAYMTASAVSGAAFTTFNAHVDGAGKDICKNSAINCNIYGAKEYVWLNGGPTANGLGPDGDYFFAVLVPGGQPNPNDGGDKNLSDDYDCYSNRTFTVTDGEVSAYSGYACGGSYPFQTKHWLDDGKSGPKPNDKPPYIRLFPYADTTNNGGVYILAICSLEGGYPVEPRDCKYDAFKVRQGKMDYSFYLSGMKFEDMYADEVKDAGDTGLEGWKILISGTGPDGQPFSAEAFTDGNGFWEWYSPVYTFTGGSKPMAITVTVCEELQPGWTQSYPGGNGCHSFSFTPTGFDSFFDIDFGNWYPVDVTACKARDLYGEDDEPTPVPGWEVSLTEEGVVVDTQLTGEDGCNTWTDLTPGISYDVHEGTKPGWEPQGPVDYVFERAMSGESYSYTFVNMPMEGCTPGFWQGGNGFETAGGKWLWNEDNDPEWSASGGMGFNPYKWDDSFCGFFGCSETGTMWYYINPDMWTVNDEFHRAARSLTAAYLNASYGIGYPYSTAELQQMWDTAYLAGADALQALHTELDAANNAYYREEPPAHCPISANMP